MKGLAKAEEEPTFVFFSSLLRANTTTLPGCAFLQSQAWLLAVPEEGVAIPFPAFLLPMPSSWRGTEAREGMDILSLTEEARIYNGLKTISLTSGAGKSGQPLVKE